MKLVIGLGNPGEKYKNNRHNVGQRFVEYLLSGILNLGADVRAAKTDVFMNNSGGFVLSLYSKYKIQNSDLFIVHDDLDLPLGKWKIQLGKGPELHYGIQSVESELGTKDFWRIRIGVDNRDFANRMPGEEYVLKDFSEEEKRVLEEEVFPEIRKKLSGLISE